LLKSCSLPEWEGESLTLGRLAARALPEASRCQRLEDLAPRLGLAVPDAETPGAMARFLASCFQNLLELVPSERRVSIGELERWIAEGSAKVDFSRFAFGVDLLAQIPEQPGIYLMRDRAGAVIYVGKSHNLRRRVRSYFAPRALTNAKAARIHEQLYSLEVLTCKTEVEALLLEMRMIRDFRPSINLQTEIHEQSGRYGRTHNLLLLAPVGDKAEIYLLKGGAFVARHSVPLGRTSSGKLRTRIRTAYFGSRNPRRAQGEAWETALVERWLSSNRKHLNLIDVDEAGTYDSVLRRLDAYLMDPERLTGKVYYR
jgi:hypothetical protein